jgi:DNA-binding NarL/FixJ family response regulator
MMNEKASIKIVIADDHAVVREGTRTLLEREADMELVGETGNGNKALDSSRR